ncbi:MAG: hypothetical protein AAFP86_23830, partial [Planctomycetota bacterium]
MKLTLDSLSSIVREQLGKLPSLSSMEALVNEAGESWVDAHSWVYLRDRSQALELTAGVESYRLGLGVRSINSIDRPSSQYGPIPLVDFDRLERERNSYYGERARRHDPIATLRWDTREGDDRPRLYLEVWPSETTERANVIYQAGWLPLDKKAEVADVPPPLATSFVKWLRLYAQHREVPDEYPMGTMDAFKQGADFMAAKRIDGQVHKRIIPGPGGAQAYYGRKRRRSRGFYDRGDYVVGTDPYAPGEAFRWHRSVADST